MRIVVWGFRGRLDILAVLFDCCIHLHTVSMIKIGRPSTGASSLAKRPADDASSCERRRKSPRLITPEVDRTALLSVYWTVKSLLIANIELAIKHELTAGLDLHDEMFGKS